MRAHELAHDEEVEAEPLAVSVVLERLEELWQEASWIGAPRLWTLSVTRCSSPIAAIETGSTEECWGRNSALRDLFSQRSPTVR